MGASVQVLFEPFELGGLGLPNRIVMAPMTRSRCPGGVPAEEVAAYYRRRAEGGVGLIVTEGVVVDHPAASGYPDVPRLHGDDALAGWRRVVEEVHSAGAAIAPQLWHVGGYRRRGMPPDPSVPGYAPSAVPHAAHGGEGEPPVAMSESDIADVIAAFGRAAAAARDVGFDAVEIHGAHGYLVDQFLWEHTNRRTDRWGGDIEGRVRFAVEVVRAVRAAVGPGLPVIFRFSQWKIGALDARIAHTPEELERVLVPLAEAGVDVFHASTRRYWEPEFPGSELNLAGWARRLTGRPAITVGSVGLERDVAAPGRGAGSPPRRLDDLAERLGRGEFDLVAVGRALLADPHWPRKVREGRWDEIQPFTPECLERLA